MMINRKCSQLFLIISLTFTFMKAQEKIKVLLTNPTVPSAGVEMLVEKGYEIIRIDRETKEDVLKNVPGAHALFWASGLRLDSEILDAAGPQLKVVGIMSAGYNHIDVKELQKRGIKAGNVAIVLSDAAADTAVLLILATSRRIRENRIAMDSNFWSPNNWSWMLGQDIINSTVGIIGFGSIGHKIVQRLKGFAVRQFLYTGVTEKSTGKQVGAKHVSLNILLNDSDFVILAIPYTPETEGMCNSKFFGRMKRTAIFINISRGSIIDEPSLAFALKTGTIFAAGLDLMTHAPGFPELMMLPNAVVLPHISSATKFTRNAMSMLTAANIIKGIQGEDLITSIIPKD